MGGLRRPVRARRPPARLAAGPAAQPKINKKKAARATPAADKTTPPKDIPMVEVPLDAVKAPASGGIVDAGHPRKVRSDGSQAEERATGEYDSQE